MRYRSRHAPSAQRDLALVAGLVVLADVCAVADVGPRWLGVAFGAPLVLFLPGYALVRATRPDQLDAAQMLAASVAISLAIAILAGVALNWLPGGIDSGSEAAVLSIVAVLSAIVAWTRHCALWRDGRRQAGTRRRRRTAPGLGALLAGGAAVALTSLGLVIAQQAAARQQQADTPTALWLSPGAAQHGRLQLGVSNGDRGPASYRLELVEGATVLRSWSIALPRGGTWSTEIDQPKASPHRRVAAMLYRSGEAAPFRRVAEAVTR